METLPSSLRRFIACRRLKHANQAFVRRDRFDDAIMYLYPGKVNLDHQKKRKIKPSTNPVCRPANNGTWAPLARRGWEAISCTSPGSNGQIIDF
jgi:hypothetical protein